MVVYAITETITAMKTTRSTISRFLNCFCSTVAINLLSTRLFRSTATVTTIKSASGMARSRVAIDSDNKERRIYSLAKTQPKCQMLVFEIDV